MRPVARTRRTGGSQSQAGARGARRGGGIERRVGVQGPAVDVGDKIRGAGGERRGGGIVSRPVALFEDAARMIGVPLSWASDPGLHSILASESKGYVGRPNYTFPKANDAAFWPVIHKILRAGPNVWRPSGRWIAGLDGCSWQAAGS